MRQRDVGSGHCQGCTAKHEQSRPIRWPVVWGRLTGSRSCEVYSILSRIILLLRACIGNLTKYQTSNVYTFIPPKNKTNLLEYSFWEQMSLMYTLCIFDAYEYNYNYIITNDCISVNTQWTINMLIVFVCLIVRFHSVKHQNTSFTWTCCNNVLNIMWIFYSSLELKYIFSYFLETFSLICHIYPNTSPRHIRL